MVLKPGTIRTIGMIWKLRTIGMIWKLGMMRTILSTGFKQYSSAVGMPFRAYAVCVCALVINKLVLFETFVRALKRPEVFLFDPSTP